LIQWRKLAPRIARKAKVSTAVAPGQSEKPTQEPGEKEHDVGLSS
jgi:hypothetical protein